MRVKILDENTLDEKVFSYLSEEEKTELKERVKENVALPVCVSSNNEVQLYSILEFKQDRIYVREVCGKNIFRHIKGLEIFAHALAKRYKKDFVSFCAKKDGIKMIGERLGYMPNVFGEYEKVV